MKKLDAKNDEKVIFSCIVKKKNTMGIQVDRILLLTNVNLYNLEKKLSDKVKINRCISLKNIQGFTKCKDSGNLSFIVHIINEYDL